MAPRTRASSFPNVVIERDSDTEESSEEEEEEEDVDDGVQNDAEEASDEERVKNEEEASTSTKRKREPITISLKKVCKVCVLCWFLFRFSLGFFW